VGWGGAVANGRVRTKKEENKDTEDEEEASLGCLSSQFFLI